MPATCRDPLPLSLSLSLSLCASSADQQRDVYYRTDRPRYENKLSYFDTRIARVTTRPWTLRASRLISLAFRENFHTIVMRALTTVIYIT